MTSLAEIGDHDFDVAVTLDNALPHLTAGQLSLAVGAVGSKLRSNGLFIASIRDYDSLILERSPGQEPAFYVGKEDRRIVHQVWGWIDDARYTLHLYITVQSERVWTTHHFVSEYRCLLRNELSTVLQATGFRDVRWLMACRE
jgi:glycine/sarcosine N-methyltransferase